MKKFSLILVSCLFFSIMKSQTTYTVNAGSYYYNPSNLTINVGDSVVWINDGGYHDVNGNINSITGQSFNNPETFDSPPTSSTGAVIYGHRFTIPGTYNYDCSVGSHAVNGMVGSIVVVQTILDTALSLQGIIDFDLPSGGATGKAIHLYATKNISDLSMYGIGVANNGQGSDGQEYTFPVMSLSQGDHLLLARDTNEMSIYFDSCFSSFNIVLQATNSISQNGNDAIELFENGSIIETFGDPNVDGTGEPWEYKDSWAFKDTNGSVVFGVNNWSLGGVDCTDGSTTTLNSACPYPMCVVPPPPPPPVNTSNITFLVDMSQVTDNFNTPELNGTFNGWCGNCNPMTDSNGDEIWQVSLDLNHGDTIEYKFSADNWTIQETNDPNDFCTNGDPTYTNRVLIVPQNDTTLLDVCWGSCTICGLPPSNIEGQYLFSNVRIYSNPANGKLNMKFRKSVDDIIIQDLFGRYISKININSNSYSLDVSGFPTNVYILSYLMDGMLYNEKFIVLH